VQKYNNYLKLPNVLVKISFFNFLKFFVFDFLEGLLAPYPFALLTSPRPSVYFRLFSYILSRILSTIFLGLKIRFKYVRLLSLCLFSRFPVFTPSFFYDDDIKLLFAIILLFTP